MRLLRKLVLAISLAFLPVLATIEYLGLTRELRIQEQDARRDLALLGRVMQRSVAHDWEAHGEAQALAEMKEEADLEPPAAVRWIAAGAEQPADPGRISVRIPVEAGGLRRGEIELSESRDRLHQYARSRLLRLSGLTAALVLVSLAVAYGLGARLVGARFARLVEQTRRIGAGDLGARVSLSGDDEIAALAEQMNAMSERLASAHAAADNANAERVAMLSQLRHADRLASIGRVASALAHELGTPLNVVLGRAKLITEAEGSASETSRNAEIIRAQAQRMTETVRGLLGFARRQPTPLAPVDLRTVAQEGLRLLDPLARRCGVQLDLRAPDAPALVAGRRGEIEQVFTNLVTNAIDAMASGGAVEVDIAEALGSERPGLRANARFRCLSIRDHGPGIGEAEIAQLFEPFYTTKAEGSGTGLGLWIADGIVRDHGGWIDVQSQAGEGTRFSVYLPAERGA